MNDTRYLISVLTADDSQEIEAVAYAYGDLNVMQYLTRRIDEAMGSKDAGTIFKATLDEVPRVGSSTVTRTLAAVTGDADVVAYVLRKKVAAERKATTPTTAPEWDTAPVEG